MYHKRRGRLGSTAAFARDRRRVRELEIRARLLEIAHDRLVDTALAQDRIERA